MTFIIDPYRFASDPFDPATDLTNFDIWVDAANVTTSGSDITNIGNAAAAGGSFSKVAASSYMQVSSVGGLPSIFTDGQAYNWSVGRWLSDDVYDIYLAAKGAAQTNRALFAQHRGSADSGRIVFATKETATADKARTFFNNGTSYTGDSATIAFDDTTNVIRWYSAGAGDHYIQVNDGTPTLVITGQTVTPYNTDLRIGGVGGKAGEPSITVAFTGHILEAFLCDAVQSSTVASAANAYLMDKFSVT